MGVYVMVGVKVNVGVRLGVKVAVGVRVMVGVNVGVRDGVGVAVDGGPMYSTSMNENPHSRRKRSGTRNDSQLEQQ